MNLRITTVVLACFATGVALAQEPTTPPALPVQTRESMARDQAASILRRIMAPAPSRTRMDRALAIAGLDDKVQKATLDGALAAAKSGYDAWRPGAEQALAGELRPALEAQPGPTVPPACTRSVITRWDEGMKFEADAFEQALAAVPAGNDAAIGMARTIFRGLQAQAINGGDAPAQLADLRRADLLEAALRCGVGGEVSAEQLRGMLSTYEEDRTRLIREGAEAAMAADARRLEVVTVVSAWYERKTSINADPRQDLRHSAGSGPVIISLQNAPQVDVSARFADLQRRTAEQLTNVLGPKAAWCLYVQFLASGRTDSPSDRIAALERVAASLPADRRDAALTLIREFCVTDRQAMQRDVAAMQKSIEDFVAPVRSTLKPGAVKALTDAQLEEINKTLELRALSGGAYGALNAVDQRKRSTADLEKKVRAMAE
jgi:hypothetical protein